MARSLQAAKVSFQQHPAWAPRSFVNMNPRSLPSVASKKSHPQGIPISSILSNSQDSSSMFINMLLINAIAETTKKRSWKKNSANYHEKNTRMSQFQSQNENSPYIPNSKNGISLDIQVDSIKSLEAAQCFAEMRSAASTKPHVPFFGVKNWTTLRRDQLHKKMSWHWR